LRNLDEILADAKGKNVDRFQPHAHDTRTAVETVVESKAAPTVVKTHKSRKISTRGLLLLLVLTMAAIGSVVALASSGSIPNFSTGGGSTPTPAFYNETRIGMVSYTFISSTQVDVTFNGTARMDTFYIKSPQGNAYQAQLSVTFTTPGTLHINLNDPSYKLTGSAFTFVPGAYTLTLVTVKNNQNTFILSR